MSPASMAVSRAIRSSRSGRKILSAGRLEWCSGCSCTRVKPSLHSWEIAGSTLRWTTIFHRHYSWAASRLISYLPSERCEVIEQVSVALSPCGLRKMWRWQKRVLWRSCAGATCLLHNGSTRRRFFFFRPFISSSPTQSPRTTREYN